MYAPFNKGFFDKRYKQIGGIKKLEKLIKSKVRQTDIAKIFNISRARIGQIMTAYKNNNFTTVLGRPRKNKRK